MEYTDKVGSTVVCLDYHENIKIILDYIKMILDYIKMISDKTRKADGN
jgi:hypothetical protein